MKRILTFIPALVLCLAAAHAHAPADVTLAFNAETRVLTVGFSHKVRDAADHYISRITVSRNGDEVITQMISLQETADGGTLLYTLPDAGAGDTIEVALGCVKGGMKKRTLTVE